MNSSIFSFRKEFLAIGLVLLGLLAAELVLRRFAHRVSTNFRELAQIDSKREQLQKRNSGQSAIVIGNSLTLCGIDQKPGIESTETDIRFIALNGSFITEWKWIFNNKFAGSDSVDVVVINTNVISIKDTSSIALPRMARTFPTLLSTTKAWSDVQTVDKIIDLAASNQSVLYAWRNQLGGAIQEKLVPNYQLGKRQIAAVAKKANDSKANANNKSTEPKSPTFNRFAEFCKLAQEHQIEVVVMFLPTKEEYDIPDEVIQNQCHVVDLRDQPQLTEMFTDKVHLNGEGMATFSPVYYHALHAQLAKLTSKENTTAQ